MTMIRRAAGPAVGALCAALFTVAPAGAQTTTLDLRVDTAADAGDAGPGDGTCATEAGVCSLRAAVDEANAASGAVIITVAEGVDPILSLAGGDEDANASGDLDTNGDITIRGTATIDAAGLDRVLHHHSGTLALEGVTVTGGMLVHDDWDDAQRGAGILATADVSLTDVTVQGNEIAYTGGSGQGLGAGVAVVGATLLATTSTVVDNTGDGSPVAPASVNGGGLDAEDADVTLVDSEIRDNGVFGNGGGISALRSTLSLLRTTVDGNSAYARQAWGGAGLYVAESTVTIAESDIIGNGLGGWYIDGGGVLASDSSLTITGTSIDGNWVGGDGSAAGGGIASYGSDVVLTDSSVSGNNVRDIDRAQGGGMVFGGGSLQLDNVTVAGNHAGATQASEVSTGSGLRIAGAVGTITDSRVTGNSVGGGLAIEGSQLEIIRSEIAGNTAGPADGPPAPSGPGGGGLRISDGSEVSIADSSITDNVADHYDDPEWGYAYDGGGIAVVASEVNVSGTTISGNTAAAGGAISGDEAATVTIERSTVSGNGAFDRGGAVSGPVSILASTVTGNNGPNSFGGGDLTSAASILRAGDGPLCETAAISGGWNVASDASCRLTGTGDREGVDPLLSPLGEYGGTTRTHRPRRGSPAVDAIPTGTPDLCDGDLTTDQRGEPRPSGEGCDVGSFERRK